MAINVGEVAALKTTGERVFVLGDMENGTFKVRRAQIGQNGIKHDTEIFADVELENIEENIERELSEILLKRKIEKKLFEQYKKELEAQDTVETDTEQLILN